MALNKKKAAEKSKADAMIEEMEKENSVNTTIEDLQANEETQPPKEKKEPKEKPKEPVKKITKAAKHPGGRPSYQSQGKTKRQQYTLTLQPEMYKDILDRAASEDISFAKYVERAVTEYIKNHR